MARDGVSGSSLDLSERTFELVVCERFHLPAVVADEVMVVLTV